MANEEVTRVSDLESNSRGRAPPYNNMEGQQATPAIFQEFLRFMEQEKQQNAQERLQHAQEMENLRKRHEDQLRALKQDFDSRAQNLTAMTPPSPGQGSPARVRPILPDIPTFSGDRKEYRQWATQARQKLTIDAPTYPDDHSKFAYLVSRLTGTAAQWVQPLITQATAAGTYNTDALTIRLDEGFLDQHAEENALQRLYNLRQRPKTLYFAYLALYEKLLSEAGVALTGDTETSRNWIHTFRNSLNEDLRDLIIASTVSLHPYTRNWKQWTTQVGILAGAMENKRKETSSWRAPTPRHAPNNRQTEPMDLDPPGLARTGHSKGQKRAKWVSKDVLRERYEEKRCIRCGASSHQQFRCPYLPARPPSHPASPKMGRSQTEKPPEIEDNDEPEISEDSGKE